MNTHFKKWRDAGYREGAKGAERTAPESVPSRYRNSWLRGYDTRRAWEQSPAQKTIRILFLDIDGVMNSVASIQEVERIRERCPNFPESREWLQCFPERLTYHPTSIWKWFPERSINALNTITTVADAHIVISSTWKDDAITPLRRWGARANIIGVTPFLERDHCRGDEIQFWLDRFKDTRHAPTVESIVILDDDPDMGHLMSRLVQTDAHGHGLTEEHVERAIALLSTPL